MSDTHKAALAEGREQGRAVRRYLEALAAHQPKRGRKRDLSNVQARLDAIEEKMGTPGFIWPRSASTCKQRWMQAAMTVVTPWRMPRKGSSLLLLATASARGLRTRRGASAVSHPMSCAVQASPAPGRSGIREWCNWQHVWFWTRRLGVRIPACEQTGLVRRNGLLLIQVDSCSVLVLRPAPFRSGA
jgi:hypothetical protein